MPRDLNTPSASSSSSSEDENIDNLPEDIGPLAFVIGEKKKETPDERATRIREEAGGDTAKVVDLQRRMPAGYEPTVLRDMFATARRYITFVGQVAPEHVVWCAHYDVMCGT